MWGCRVESLTKTAKPGRSYTTSRFDSPSQPSLHALGLKTVEELVAHESNLMVFKSFHGMGPHYMSNFL